MDTKKTFDIKLKKGVVSVVNFTSDAIWVASRYGSYKIISMKEFRHPFLLSEFLQDNKTDVLIINGFDPRNVKEQDIDRLKLFVSEEKVALERKNKDSVVVRTPHVMLCTGRSNYIPFTRNSRRFRVLPF